MILCELFLKGFLINPEDAVERLKQSVRHGRWTGREVAEVLLPYLVKASYAQQNLIFGALNEMTSPDDLLSAALALHEREDDHRILEVADALLEYRGPVGLFSRGLLFRVLSRMSDGVTMNDNDVFFACGQIFGMLSKFTPEQLENAALLEGLKPEYARMLRLLAELRRKWSES